MNPGNPVLLCVQTDLRKDQDSGHEPRGGDFL